VTSSGRRSGWAAGAKSTPTPRWPKSPRRYLRAYGPAPEATSRAGGVPGPASATEHGPVWPATSRLYRSTGSAPDILASDVERIKKQPTGDPFSCFRRSIHTSWATRAAITSLKRPTSRRSAVRRDGSQPVVLVDGRVAGTWTHAAVKGTLQLTVEPFQRLASKTKVEVRRRAESLAQTLGLARTEVRIP